MPKPDARENCNAFCRGLSPETRARLCRSCLHLDLKPRQEVIFEYSATQVAIINVGIVLSLMLTEDGNQKIAEILRPGDLLGVASVFSGEEEQALYMSALTEVRLCLIPANVVEILFQQSPDFATALMKNTTRRLQKSVLHLVNIQTMRSEKKVKYIFDTLNAEEIDTSLLTQEDISVLANVNRVTVSRAIKTINSFGDKKLHAIRNPHHDE